MKKLNTLLCMFLCISMLAGCASVSIPGTISPEQTEDEEQIIPSLNYDTSASADALSLDPETYSDDYVTVKEADPGLEILVKAPDGYSAGDVLAGITLENCTNPTLTSGDSDLIDPDILTATGSDGNFYITADGGFKEGNAYKITLTDASLSFDGQESAVRCYNLTIAREAVNNIRLNDSVKLLSTDELSSEDANEVMLLDGLVGYDSQLGLLGDGEGTGSFSADAGLYVVGDIVAVYEGEEPENRTFDDSGYGLSYVKITSVNELTDSKAEYAYESADTADVLFSPDVIPVNQEGSYTGGTGEITLKHSEVLFSSDDQTSTLGLNENTTVDAGDYLAFYTGDLQSGQVTSYAEVTNVSYSETDDEDYITITYMETTLDDMMESSDMYYQSYLTEEQIRSGYDEETVKAGMIADMDENGLLSSNTYELAESVMDTDDFREAFGDTPLEDLTFYFGEDESISLKGSDYARYESGEDEQLLGSVNVKGDADVDVSPNIVHYAGKTGYGTGVRVEGYAKYIITIKSDDPEAKSALKITLTFFLEGEFVMGLTVDVTTIWKWAWIIPYIYDFSVSGSFGTGVYVGAGFTTVATLVKNEKEKTEDEKLAGLDWPDDVDKTAGSERVMKVAEYIKNAGAGHDKLFPAQDTGGGSLAQKYASFALSANGKDWVDLVDENIFDWNGAIDPFHIVAFRIKTDFVVSAELHVALGVAINWDNAYIETFNFLLFHEGYSANELKDNTGSTFRLDVYLFGAIGIRAGFRIKLEVGLIDARLDAIGLELEAGLYLRLWGYIYGAIEITGIGTKDRKTDAFFSGGLLIEAGLYYTVAFVAEMADGSISYKKTIASDDLPLFNVGTENVTSDFAYEEGDESLNFYGQFDENNLKCEIPSEVAQMMAMSLKTGAVSAVSKADTNLESNYDIAFDDNAFSYSYEDGKHYIVMDYAKRSGNQGSVNITLTWMGSALELDTHTFKRTIRMDYVCDMKTISFLNKDGSCFFMVSKPAGTAMTNDDYPASDPSAAGYTFIGWTDSEGNAVESFPAVMPSENTTYVSEWERNHAAVTVNYQLPVSINQYGTVTAYYTDTSDTFPELAYPGDEISDILSLLKENHLLRTESDCIYDHTFADYYVINTANSTLSCDSVAANGSTTFTICLDYPRINLTFDLGDGDIRYQIVNFGSLLEFPEASKTGYRIIGWKDDDGNIFTSDTPSTCNKDKTYYAIWEEIPPTVTVTAEVKKKVGFQYMFVKIKSETYELDSLEVTVQELIDLLQLDEYTFDPDNSAYTADDTITLSPDGDTSVRLRFKQN